MVRGPSILTLEELMRLIFIGLLLLPVLAWGGEKKSPVDDLRKDAEEDICYALSEYREAYTYFQQQTGGSYNPASAGGRLARNSDLKRSRVLTLQKRYIRHYSSEFDAIRNPSLCPPPKTALTLTP